MDVLSGVLAQAVMVVIRSCRCILMMSTDHSRIQYCQSIIEGTCYTCMYTRRMGEVLPVSLYQSVLGVGRIV